MAFQEPLPIGGTGEPSAAARLTAAQMQEALYRHYAGRCAVLFEVSTDTPIEEGPSGWRVRGQRRRIDVLTVAKARKRGIGPLDLLAIEIKVSRGDFLADVNDPAKQAPWREVAHRHAYAAPEGLIRSEEVPAGSGLLTVKPSRSAAYWDVNWAVRARYAESPPVPAGLTLTLAWRMSVAEAKIRGLSGPARHEAPDDLRAALIKARTRAELLDTQLDRARAEISNWKTAFAAAGHLPCQHCRQPVKPRSVRRGHFTDWRHVSRADDAACEQIRAAVSRWADIQPADDVEPQEVSA